MIDLETQKVQDRKGSFVRKSFLGRSCFSRDDSFLLPFISCPFVRSQPVFFFFFFWATQSSYSRSFLQEGTQLHLLSCGCRSGRTSWGEFGHYRAERKTVYHWHHICMPSDQPFDSTTISFPNLSLQDIFLCFFRKSRRKVIQKSLLSWLSGISY